MKVQEYYHNEYRFCQFAGKKYFLDLSKHRLKIDDEKNPLALCESLL